MGDILFEGRNLSEKARDNKVYIRPI